MAKCHFRSWHCGTHEKPNAAFRGREENGGGEENDEGRGQRQGGGNGAGGPRWREADVGAKVQENVEAVLVRPVTGAWNHVLPVVRVVLRNFCEWLGRDRFPRIYSSTGKFAQ